MSIAQVVATRSKDPNTQVGAVIVDQENCIVSTGYNGMPTGCSDDEFPWEREAKHPNDTKYPYVCHAELNAILSAGSKLYGHTLYTTLFPCNECAKAIIQSGISTIIYKENLYPDSNSTLASQVMLEAASTDIVKFEGRSLQEITK